MALGTYWSLRKLEISLFQGSLSPKKGQENARYFSSWPLVGNEGMNAQYTNVKVDSLIPY